MPNPTIITLEPILPVQIVAKAFPEVLAGDVDVSVNSTLYDTETPPGSVNVPVTNLNNAPVGVVTPGVGVKVGNSLVLIKKTGGALIEAKAVVAEGENETTVDDSVVVIKDSGGVVLHSKSVKADDIAEQVVSDSTVNVRKSDGVLIAAVPVKAQATVPYDVANSTVTMKDTAGATLDSKSVKATESAELTAPNATAPIKDSAGALLKTETIKSGETRDVGIGDSVLTLNGDAFLNVKAQASQNIQLLSSVDDSEIVPASVVGGVIKVAPGGGGGGNITIIDRFNNNIGTFAKGTGNETWDLRTLTPADWATIYLSRLTNPPTGAQLTAVFTFFTNMVAAGIFQGSHKIELDIGANAADHAWNARYPFDNNSSMKSEYIGSPTHNANGVSLNGTSQAVRTNAFPRHLNDFDKQVSIYVRNNNFGGVLFAAGLSFYTQCFGIFEDSGNGRYRNYNEGLQISPFGNGVTGLHSQIRSSDTTMKMMRNGSHNNNSPYTTTANYQKLGDEFIIGAQMTQLLAFQSFKILNYSYFRVGNALTDSQETDHYNIVQALQTAFSRQV